MVLGANAVKLVDYHDHDGDAQDDDDAKMLANIKINKYEDVPDIAEANSHGIYSDDAMKIVPDMPELKALHQVAEKEKLELVAQKKAEQAKKAAQ